LSPQAERLLHSVPASIGDPLTEDQPQGAAIDPDPAGIGSFMAAIAFEEEDVRDTLGEVFEWLADKFDSDHWELTERQARMLGRPTAQLLNSVWAKLQSKLPDILARWCDETPGATAFIIACGIVVGPKVAKQVTLSRAKKKAVPMVKPPSSHGQPQPVPKPPSAPQSGLIYQEAVDQ
jgi:hypothetical protein